MILFEDYETALEYTFNKMNAEVVKICFGAYVVKVGGEIVGYVKGEKEYEYNY